MSSGYGIRTCLDGFALLDIASGKETPIALPAGMCPAAPLWSPDGRLIAFSSKHEGGIYQIYTVWADGSKLARRTSGETNKQSPAWIAREAIGYPLR